MDGAGDIHPEVGVFPGPAGGDGGLVEQQRLEVLPFGHDAVEDHPVLVGVVGGHHGHPLGIEHALPVSGQQAAAGLSDVGYEDLDVGLDLQRSEVVDARRPLEVPLQQLCS